jgi:hypothetical protein
MGIRNQLEECKFSGKSVAMPNYMSMRIYETYFGLCFFYFLVLGNTFSRNTFQQIFLAAWTTFEFFLTKARMHSKIAAVFGHMGDHMRGRIYLNIFILNK